MKIRESITLYRKALEKQLENEARSLSQDARNEINMALEHLRNAETKIHAAVGVAEKITP